MYAVRRTAYGPIIYFGPPKYIYQITNYRIQIGCFVEFLDVAVQMSRQHIGWILFLVFALARLNLLFTRIFIQLRAHTDQSHFIYFMIQLNYVCFMPQRFVHELKYAFIDCRWFCLCAT